MRKRYYLLTAVTLTIAAAFLASQKWKAAAPDPRILPPDAVDASIEYSNILPGDYVGPETCRSCHPSQYGQWRRHAHSRMNQLPSAESVLGDFRDCRVHLPGGAVHFDLADGQYTMTVFRGGRQHRRYIVTRTVGSRFMQFYIGKQVQGPEPPNDSIYDEHMLPFAYSLKMRRWLPRQYFDNDGDEILKDGVPQVEAVHRRPDVRSYTHVCMNCHNTYPYAYRIFRRDLVGFPDATIAAAIEPLADALSKTIPVEPTVQAFAGLNKRLDPDKHLVTLGISCESCHFGGKEHAEHEKEIRFLPTSKYLRVLEKPSAPRPLTASRRNPVTVLGICTQCHAGNGRLYPNGATKSNSREGLDMHAGFCKSQLRCVDCHDPHKPSGITPGGPTLPRHLAQCLKCHPQYSEPAAALAHSKHPPGAAVDCLDCHMPRYAQGLDELVRTHRICHPVEEVMVREGSANACNLCHLDKSLRWTLDQVELLWGRGIEPQPDWPVWHDLDRPVGECWLHGDDNHLRLVAVQCYAKSRWAKTRLPELLDALNDPEPLNRMFAACAVQRLLGRPVHAPLEVDITATPAERAAAIRELRKQLK